MGSIIVLLLHIHYLALGAVFLFFHFVRVVVSLVHRSLILHVIGGNEVLCL